MRQCFIGGVVGLLFDGSDGLVGEKDEMYMYREKLETVVTI